jgi:hypothetical protein
MIIRQITRPAPFAAFFCAPFPFAPASKPKVRGKEKRAAAAGGIPFRVMTSGDQDTLRIYPNQPGTI